MLVNDSYQSGAISTTTDKVVPLAQPLQVKFYLGTYCFISYVSGLSFRSAATRGLLDHDSFTFKGTTRSLLLEQFIGVLFNLVPTCSYIVDSSATN